MLDNLDHRYINELPQFLDQNATAENIAKYIFDYIKTGEIGIYRVSVWETPTSCATYFET